MADEFTISHVGELLFEFNLLPLVRGIVPPRFW